MTKAWHGFAWLLIGAVSWAHAGIAEHVIRKPVAQVDLVIYPTRIKDVVTIVGALPAGDAFAARGNAAAATLTGLMLERGTVDMDQFAIARQLDDVGASIQFGVSNETLDIRARCLSKDIPLVVRLLAQELRRPAFAPAELEKARQQFIGELQTQLSSTNARAGEAMNRAIYPVGHPSRMHSLEEFLEQAQSATLDDVRSFYAEHYGPRDLTLVFVGAVNPREVQRQVEREFKGWTGGVPVLEAAQPAPATASAAEDIAVPGKSSVSVLLGQATRLRYRDSDTLALRVGTAILGTGFTGRLMSTVRDREGLTYGIGAGVSEDTFNDGLFAVSASFAPQLMDRGVASARRELARWWRDGVTADELARRKESIVGTYQVSLSTTGGLASALLLALQRGLGIDWVDRYPQAIRALTLEKVNAAIHVHLDPEQMILIRAGTLPEAAAR